MLDTIDRRIIAALRRDARVSVTTLAAELKLARATVKSRLDRLVETRVIERFTIDLGADVALDAVRGRREHLTIFGTDYRTPDGTCIRDYVHVLDLVDAHVRGLEHLLAGGDSGVFNLGTGRGFSVREVIDAVGDVTDAPVPVVEGARRPGDCTALVSGSRLAEAVLGWRPQRSDLRTMISDAWGWHQMPGYSA